MGRTGKMFAAEHSGVVPDILLLAKGIASGMPLGAMMAPRERHDLAGGQPRLDDARATRCAIAAALATIELLEGELVDNSARWATISKAALATALAGERARSRTCAAWA